MSKLNAQENIEPESNGFCAIAPPLPTNRPITPQDVADQVFGIIAERDIFNETARVLAERIADKEEIIRAVHQANDDLAKQLMTMTKKAEKYRVERDQANQELADRANSCPGTCVGDAA